MEEKVLMPALRKMKRKLRPLARCFFCEKWSPAATQRLVRGHDRNSPVRICSCCVQRGVLPGGAIEASEPIPAGGAQ